MKYKSEKEILDVVKNFEAGTIKRGTWGHPEHLIVAFYYSQGSDFDNALKKMKEGIFNLLKAFEVDLTKEMPYHETLTVFWMKTVYEFAKSHKNKPLVETINEVIERFDKNYPLNFYSKEQLFSDEARVKFVKADLAGQYNGV